MVAGCARGDVVAGRDGRSSGNGLSWFYTFEWPVFAGIAARGVVAPDPRGPRGAGGAAAQSARRSTRPSARPNGEPAGSAEARAADRDATRSALASLTSVDRGGSVAEQTEALTSRRRPARAPVGLQRTGSSSGSPPSRPACLVGFVVFVIVRGPSQPAGAGHRRARGAAAARRSSRARPPRPSRCRPSAAAIRCRCRPSGGRRSSSTSSPRGVRTARPSSARWPTVARRERRDRWPWSASTPTRAPTRRPRSCSPRPTPPTPWRSMRSATVATRVPRQRAAGQLLPRRRRARSSGAALGPQTRVVARSAGWHASRRGRAGERAAPSRRGDAGPPSPPGRGPARTRRPTAPPIDRAAALAEGAPGIPAKFVFWVLGVVARPEPGWPARRARVLLGRAQPASRRRTTTTAPNPVPRRPADTPAPPSRRPVPRRAAARRSWA